MCCLIEECKSWGSGTSSGDINTEVAALIARLLLLVIELGELSSDT